MENIIFSNGLSAQTRWLFFRVKRIRMKPRTVNRSMYTLSIFYNPIWPLCQEIPDSCISVFWEILFITLNNLQVNTSREKVVSNINVISTLDFELPGYWKCWILCLSQTVDSENLDLRTGTWAAKDNFASTFPFQCRAKNRCRRRKMLSRRRKSGDASHLIRHPQLE